MDGKKVYQIQINGITESVNAVDALNKQLDALEQRIKALESRSIKIGTAGGSGSGSKTGSGSLSEEEKLLRQIATTEEKIKTYSKDIYQNYLASKDVLKETLRDQKEVAAQERLQANNYTNTMKGLKERLADIKTMMQTTDIGSDMFKKYTKEANDLTAKLKELEEAYGQFGRNVGNYKSAVDGFKQLEITVNGVVRSFGSAREAYRTLKNERDTMALAGQRDTNEFKELDETVKTLNSDIKDLSKSSAFMDNVLDTMTSFTAMASMGVGLSQLFGFDDSVFSDSMKKLTSLLLIVKSFETLAAQWKANEGFLANTFKPLFESLDKYSEKFQKKLADAFMPKFERITMDGSGGGSANALSKYYEKLFNFQSSEKSLKGVLKSLNNIQFALGKTKLTTERIDILTERWNNTTKEEQKAIYGTLMATNKVLKVSKALTSTFKVLVQTLSTIGGIFIAFLSAELLNKFGDFAKSLNTAKISADKATESIKALTRATENYKDALAASYLKGEISDTEYLNSLYTKQSALLAKQIELLGDRSKAIQKNGLFGSGYMSTNNTEFSGKKFSPTTVGAGTLSSVLGLGNDLEVTVNNIEEVEKAWRKCSDAVRQEKDIWETTVGGIRGWFGSLVTTVKDTENVMRGMGNIKLSDFINQFGELNRQLKNSEISAKEYAAGIAKLKKEMNSNEVLNSVISNLDKYIPDEEVREAVQNIINELVKLDDAFNMTSAEQVHHWNQVRIDAMKDGLKKTLEQIKENERYEIVQDAKTEEQKELIHQKYERQRQEAREKEAKDNLQKAKEQGKKLRDAENQLIALRIENMKNGLKKRLAELDNQRRLELQKVKENSVKVGELSLEINKKYDRLILEEKRKWAFDMLKTYEDLAARIAQFNAATMQTEATTATQNVQTRAQNKQLSAGYSLIYPSTYDDRKVLEEYYKEVVKIKKEAAEKEQQIEEERLAKELEYEQQEEELRHKRLVNADGGEYIQQLRAGMITQEQYDKLMEDENDAHYARMNALDKQYASNLSATTQETLEEVQKIYSDYYGNIINNLRNDKAKIDEVMSKQPETDKYGWGVVNIGKASDTYKKALEGYEELRQEILKKREQLKVDLASKSISPEAFAVRKKELDQELKSIDEACRNVRENQKMLIADFISSLQQYIQAGMQSFNQIMQAVWDAQDVAFDKEQEQLEKENELLEKKLDEQQEIIEQHKSAVESIEEELATSRGDRRQHLIDMLNAEIEAQRRAAAEEKRIQKEKEANEKKQEELEKKRKKAEYHRNLLQAIVNGALAVTMAAINKWPLPAIPMMALAASTTAAQIAIMASNKPYAKGGLLEGKSHANGGIPIPGTGIEVEGKEYVIRKKSSLENIDLLDYINKSERKLNLSDFIDFYGGKVKKNIASMSPGRKYADGGALPTIRNDYNFDDRLLSAFEDYSNRPVVVSVVDINNKQDQVRRVQTLAGL